MEQIVKRLMRNRPTTRTTTSDTRTIEGRRIATGEGSEASTEKFQRRER